jgi:hypothetical protein
MWLMISSVTFIKPECVLARWTGCFAHVFRIEKIGLQEWPGGFFRLAIAAAIFFNWQAIGSEEPPAEITVTNALQLRQLAASEEFLSCQIRLEGWAVWVSSARDQFILQDDSGATFLNLDLHNYPSLNAGQKVRLYANCLVGYGQAVCSALVDNDGDHVVREKSA